MQNIKKYILIAVIAIIGIVGLSCIGSLIEEVENEEIVVNQVPFTGTMEVWSTPGAHAQKFGRLTSYKKANPLWFGATKDGKSEGEPIRVVFNDASDGKIYGMLRVQLPTDAEHMLRIQTDYRSMEGLMNDLIRPNVTKVVYASGPLMSAFESYAEKKNDLIEYITDQLNYGVYKTTVKRVETVDPLTGELKTINVASLVPDSTAPGGYKRSERSPFAYYGIELSQVTVSEIAYSDKVNAQISQQQEANMLIQTSKAKAAAAQQEAVRAEEEGKAQAAKARWEQEKIKAVEVTKAEQEREVSRLAAEKAEFDKKKIIAQGQAEAEANRLKVAAGLTPQERAEWDYKTKVGVAKAFAEVKLPTIVSTGGGAGSNTAMDAMGLKMLVDLSNQMSH